MARKVNTFEGGTSGTTVTTANSGGASGDAANTVQTGTGYTHTFTNAQAMHGTLSLVQSGGSGTQCHFTWDFGPVDRIFGRVYFRVSTAFQARSLLQVRTASTQSVRVAINASGQLTLNNAANTVLDTSVALSTATWYRIEYDFTQSTGNATVNIYAGDSLTTTDVLTASGASIGTADYDEVRHGQIASATGLNAMHLDGLDVNDVGLPGPWSQTVTGSGITSGEAFGTAQVDLSVVPSGVASGEAFGTASVQAGLSLAPSSIGSAEAFGSATAAPGAVTVVPSSIASGEAFGSATVAPGQVSVAPGGIASAAAFGTASLSLVVAPGGVVSGEAFGTPRLDRVISVTSVAPGEAFGALTIGYTVTPGGIPTGETFGTATITAGPVSITPGGIASSEAFGSATVATSGGGGSGPLDSDTFAFNDGNAGHVCDLGSAPNVGEADVLCVNSDTIVSTPSGFSVAVSSVANQGSYIFYRFASGGEGSTVTVTTAGNFNTQVSWSRWGNFDAFDVAAATQASAAANATPTHSTGTLAESTETVVAFGALHAIGDGGQTGITWSAGFTGLTNVAQATGSTAVRGLVGYKTGAGTAAEAPQVSWSGTTAVDRYALTAAFTTDSGEPTVAPGGIGSAEAFGTAVLAPGAVSVVPGGITSGEAFGTPSVAPGAVSVAPGGIASAEGVGTASIGMEIAPSGIPSAEAFGAAILLRGDISVAPTGVPSEEAFGGATVTGGMVAAQQILPVGIAGWWMTGNTVVTVLGAPPCDCPEPQPAGAVFGVPAVTVLP